MVYRLSTEKRAQVLELLCEGNGMRATGRLSGVAQNSVLTLLAQAGEAALWTHDDLVHSVKSQRIQCDEIWSFCYAKRKNVPKAKAAPPGAGDVWLWKGQCADSRMIVSYFVGDRTGASARIFLKDLERRLANRVQLTSDAWLGYGPAVEEAFAVRGVDYAALDKIYGTEPGRSAEARYSPAQCIGTRTYVRQGKPDPAHISTSYVERSNLSLRMANARFTRLTNKFSRKLENHIHMIALYMLAYNFVKQHRSLRMSPAMAAGVSDKLWSYTDIVERMDYYAPPPKPRRPYKKRSEPR